MVTRNVMYVFGYDEGTTASIKAAVDRGNDLPGPFDSIPYVTISRGDVLKFGLRLPYSGKSILFDDVSALYNQISGSRESYTTKVRESSLPLNTSLSLEDSYILCKHCTQEIGEGGVCNCRKTSYNFLIRWLRYSFKHILRLY